MRRAFKLKWSLNHAYGGHYRAAGVAALILSIAAVPCCAQPVAQPTIVEPSGITNPVYSRNPDPSAAELIETWRSSNRYMTKKQVPFERFEIVDRRVTGGRVPRAFIQFVILPAKGGDAVSWASARCQGRAKPIEIQVYFEWSKYLGSWTPLWTRGEGNGDLCSGGKLWTARQIEQLVNPPPLPEPPRISMADVYMPPQGSIERTAIMDALRPRYEALFGAPIVFRVEKLRVAAGFAFVVVHPQRPNGVPIEVNAVGTSPRRPMFSKPGRRRSRILDAQGGRAMDDWHQQRFMRRRFHIAGRRPDWRARSIGWP